ncbi:hypothetical protein JL720_3594 [Aureococcus anophagefferens]|nr:hypothetical protein JL720_3594 [Aureococcus anophagefferens]
MYTGYGCDGQSYVDGADYADQVGGSITDYEVCTWACYLAMVDTYGDSSYMVMAVFDGANCLCYYECDCATVDSSLTSIAWAGTSVDSQNCAGLADYVAYYGQGKCALTGQETTVSGLDEDDCGSLCESSLGSSLVSVSATYDPTSDYVECTCHPSCSCLTDLDDAYAIALYYPDYETTVSGLDEDDCGSLCESSLGSSLVSVSATYDPTSDYVECTCHPSCSCLTDLDDAYAIALYYPDYVLPDACGDPTAAPAAAPTPAPTIATTPAPTPRPSPYPTYNFFYPTSLNYDTYQGQGKCALTGQETTVSGYSTDDCGSLCEDSLGSSLVSVSATYDPTSDYVECTCHPSCSCLTDLDDAYAIALYYPDYVLPDACGDPTAAPAAAPTTAAYDAYYGEGKCALTGQETTVSGLDEDDCGSLCESSLGSSLVSVSATYDPTSDYVDPYPTYNFFYPTSLNYDTYQGQGKCALTGQETTVSGYSTDDCGSLCESSLGSSLVSVSATVDPSSSSDYVECTCHPSCSCLTDLDDPYAIALYYPDYQLPSACGAPTAAPVPAPTPAPTIATTPAPTPRPSPYPTYNFFYPTSLNYDTYQGQGKCALTGQETTVSGYSTDDCGSLCEDSLGSSLVSVSATVDGTSDYVECTCHPSCSCLTDLDDYYAIALYYPDYVLPDACGAPTPAPTPGPTPAPTPAPSPLPLSPTAAPFCTQSPTAAAEHDTLYLDIESADADLLVYVTAKSQVYDAYADWSVSVTATTASCGGHESDHDLVDLGEDSAIAITVATTVAIAASTAAGVAGAVGGGAGGGAAASGSSSSTLDSAGDLLSVIAQVQFVVLASSLSIPVKEGFRDLGKSLRWMNFQVDLGWVPGMPRFGTRYDDPDSDDEDRRRLKEEAKKGIQAYLATTGNSAEEILVQTMVCGFLFMVFLVSAHLALNSYLVARQRRKGHDDYELPGMLHFPVPELAAFWIYFTGALQAGLNVLLSDDATYPWRIVASVLVASVLAVMVFICLLVMNPVARNRLVPWRARHKVHKRLANRNAVAKGGGAPQRAESYDPLFIPDGKADRDDGAVVFVLEDRGTLTFKDRWSKAYRDPQHQLGGWQAVDGGSYAAWLIETFPMVFDRLTNAVSFFVFDVVIDKIFFMLLLVLLSGTDGTIQLAAALAFAVIKVAILFVYLPFNSMLSNLRELMTATGRVIVFLVPLYACLPGLADTLGLPELGWEKASKIMLLTNLAATMGSLALQLLSTLSIAVAAAWALCAAPADHATNAAEKGVELAAKVPVAGVPAAVAGKLAFAAAQGVAESLTEPFLTYQTAFRDKRDELRAQGAAVVVKHCHRHGLGEAFPEVHDIALDVAMGMIADAITAKVCDQLPKQDPAFVVLPRAAIEETVGFLAGEAVGACFGAALEKLEGNGGDVDELEAPKGPEMEEDGGEGSFEDDEKHIVVHDPIVRLFRKPLGKKKAPRPVSVDKPQVAEEIPEVPSAPPSKAIALVDDEEAPGVQLGVAPGVDLPRLDSAVTPKAPMYSSPPMMGAAHHTQLAHKEDDVVGEEI